MIILRRLVHLGLALAAAGCQGRAATITATPTFPSTAVAASPTAELAVRTATPVPATPPPVAEAPTLTETPNALPAPYYDLEAQVDWQAHTVQVTATVRLVPPAADELVFNLNAHQQARFLAPLAASVGGIESVPEIGAVWARVPLPAGTALHEPVEVVFTYSMELQPIHPGAWGWRGTLGWTERQLNLGDWYPVLALYDQETGWQTPQSSALGEYVSTPASDYSVRLRVHGVAEPVVVVGSGGPESCGEVWCAELAGGRFVAYTVSDAMQAQTAATTTGVKVTSVYMPEHAVAGAAALQAAADALETYAELYGPYPFDTFVQIEGDFYDGMEYSGATFVGSGYYAEYDGTPNNLLTIISAHEAAHQWWHTLVGNDQAAEPWLDEALATYSELAFLENHHPGSTAWWWAFRVDWFAPDGAVDSTIYDYGDFRGYVDAVYLRGAQMLHAMRLGIGDDAFWRFLRDYAAGQAGRVAAVGDFWEAFAAAGGDGAAIRADYFDRP